MLKSKICVKCNVRKDISEFSLNKSAKDRYQKYCKACKSFVDGRHNAKSKITEAQRQANGERYAVILLKMKELQIIKGGCCEKCGESRLHLLDFHHLNKNEKIKGVGEFLRRYSLIKGFELAKKEIEKCILLCSNCHRDFHYLEKENGITTEEYLKIGSF